MSRPRSLLALLALLAIATSSLVACQSPQPTYSLTEDQLRDPSSCTTCHPDHVSQWAGSMHAYASDDPIFRAMNARAQRETQGALGDFCIECHAPVATRLGLTKDGTDLDGVPKPLRGVTCYFCHSIDQVTGSHDAAVSLATDLTLRGGITDPTENSAHRSVYSALHDRNDPSSAGLCGGCHDIVNGHGTSIERTFKEWQASVFAKDSSRTLLTCGGCHMAGTADTIVAQYPGVKVRTFHEHTFAAVDQALTDFPDTQRQATEIASQLQTALSASLCVMPSDNDTVIQVTLDDVAAGHDFPSGASQDRRAWVELVATSGSSTLLSTGVVPDGGDVTALADPNLWLFRDQMFDGNGAVTHEFQDAVTETTSALTPSVTNDPNDPRYFHAQTRTFTVAGASPDRVTLRVRFAAVGADVLADLVKSGDLDPAIAARVPTYDLGSTVLTWERANGYGCAQ